jgi:hypothetical protein
MNFALGSGIGIVTESEIRVQESESRESTDQFLPTNSVSAINHPGRRRCQGVSLHHNAGIKSVKRRILAAHDSRQVDGDPDLWRAAIEFDRPVRNVEGWIILRRHGRKIELHVSGVLGVDPGEPTDRLGVTFRAGRDGVGAADLIGECDLRLNYR